MNEQTSQPEPSPPTQDAPASVERRKSAPSLISRMSLTQLTLAVMLAVFLWQWFDTQRQVGDLRQEMARRLAEVEGGNKANQVLLTQQQETLRELSGKVALMQARDMETQSQRAALESLYQELSSSRDNMTLAQVEQMLLIAGQQLQLAANVKAALIAMQQADDYLARMNRQSLADVRAAIARDTDKLRALPDIDMPGFNLRMDNLIASVDTLPLMQDARPAPNPETPPTAADSPWQKFIREIWNDTRQMVRIENTEQAAIPLLSPSQAFFLRENLKLRLLSARTALLIRDETNYKQDLKEALSWMTRYFDVKSDTGAQALANLKKLSETDIGIKLPDVSGSLKAVRSYRAAHEAVHEKSGAR
ncbi:MAG: uroporphyrinogen-III C-methyltransferase [Gallionellaceae bacterium]|nr:uroporphyrinogen-III C-methyltransferase [Gallionellaceae bacterium]